jgi:uncharacterized phage-like protein YoqJ
VITVVSGIRELHQSSHADVARTMAVEIERASDAARNSPPSTLRFGGAIGVDSIALQAARHLRRPRHRVIFVVIVPGKLTEQPKFAYQVALRCADKIIELEFPRGAKWAYLRRNDKLLDGAQRLVAFTDGRATGGTAYTIKRAQKSGIDVELVTVRSFLKLSD